MLGKKGFFIHHRVEKKCLGIKFFIFLFIREKCRDLCAIVLVGSFSLGVQKSWLDFQPRVKSVCKCWLGQSLFCWAKSLLVFEW